MKDLEKIVFDKLKDHPKRINHTKGVIQVAVELGRIHGVNEHDCYIAALFHDYTKYDSVIEHRKYLSDDFIKKNHNKTYLYHPYSGALALKEMFPDTSEEVLNAIRYHTWARPNATKLDKIIFIADKCEPNRLHEEARKIYNLALKDLDEALLYALESNIKHIESKNLFPHPDQIKTLIYYQTEKENL